MRVQFHIGAHRTGTASFQYAIGQRRRKLLRRNKLVSFTPQMLRDLTCEHFGVIFPSEGARDDHSYQSVKAVFRAAIAESAAEGGEHVLFTDENYSGSMLPILEHGHFYKDLPRFASGIQAMFSERIEFAFALRDYASFYSSIWSQLYGIAFTEGFDHFKTKLLDIQDGWFVVVAKLKEALPDNTIRIIPFETYKGGPNAFLRAIGIETTVELPSLHTNRSMTQEIYDEFRKHYDNGKKLEQAERRAIKDAIGFDGSPIHYWSDDEKKTLNEKYRRDLKRIQAELAVDIVSMSDETDAHSN